MKARHFAAPLALVVLLSSACEHASTVAPVPQEHAMLSQKAVENLKGQKTYQIRIAAETKAKQARDRLNTEKLRQRVVGCQEWIPEANNLRINFVEAGNRQLRVPPRSASEGLIFVAGMIDYAGQGEYTRVICMLPDYVDPNQYLTDLHAHRRVRGGNASRNVSVEALKDLNKKTSAPMRALAEKTTKYVPPTSPTLVQSNDVHTLRPIFTVAFQDPFFWGLLNDSGIDEPDPEDFGDPEEEFLEYDDPDYCSGDECYDPGQGCGTPTFHALTQAAIDSVKQTKQGYCNEHAASANSNMMCMEIYIQACRTFFGLLKGDCIQGEYYHDRYAYRARFVLNTQTQQIQYQHVNWTCGTVENICYPPSEKNSIQSVPSPGGLSVQLSLYDSHPIYGAAAPAIDVGLWVTKSGDGLNVNIWAMDGYPTIGFWPGKDGGGWGEGKIFAEQTFLSLFGHGEIRCQFTLK